MRGLHQSPRESERAPGFAPPSGIPIARVASGGFAAKPRTQELRSKVRAVRPYECVQFGIEAKASKDFGILEWFKDRAN